jgi:carbonic anhydrase
MLSGRAETDPQNVVRDAVRANVRAAVNQLKHASALIEQLVLERGLLVVGAEYSLETGVVSFFDGVPSNGPSPS